jgi:hypothetical protein
MRQRFKGALKRPRQFFSGKPVKQAIEVVGVTDRGILESVPGTSVDGATTERISQEVSRDRPKPRPGRAVRRESDRRGTRKGPGKRLLKDLERHFAILAMPN